MKVEIENEKEIEIEIEKAKILNEIRNVLPESSPSQSQIFNETLQVIQSQIRNELAKSTSTIIDILTCISQHIVALQEEGKKDQKLNKKLKKEISMLEMAFVKAKKVYLQIKFNYKSEDFEKSFQSAVNSFDSIAANKLLANAIKELLQSAKTSEVKLQFISKGYLLDEFLQLCEPEGKFNHTFRLGSNVRKKLGAPEQIQICLIGIRGSSLVTNRSGQSALLQRFIEGTYKEDRAFTETEASTIEYACKFAGGTKYVFWDVGAEAPICNIASSPKKPNIIVICFSGENNNLSPSKETKEKSIQSLIKELESYNLNDIPLLLVCTKIDLRNKVKPFITTEEGKEISQNLKIKTYLECSAKDDEDVELVLNTIIKVATQNFLNENKSESEEKSGANCTIS